MRILVVGAIQGGTVPMGGAICSAFREIGQESDFVDYSDLLQEFIEVMVTKDKEQSYRFHLKLKILLFEKIFNFKPDVIFGIAQSPLNVEVLTELKKTGLILCFWFVEDYQIFKYWTRVVSYFDFFFTIQKDRFWKHLDHMGCKNYYYLPAAFDFNIEFMIDNEKPKTPVSFMGAPYPNRVHFFGKLKRNDFNIFGEEWDRHANPAIVIGDRRITENEAREIYQRSLININLHSSPYPNDFGGGDFVNPRTFELAGLGAFQLTDIRQHLTLHFDPMNEVVALSSWEDMVKAIDYFLKNKEERVAISRMAQERVMKEHTYRHRAEEILSIIS